MRIKIKSKLFLFIAFLMFIVNVKAQNYKFYVRVNSSTTTFDLVENNGRLYYQGTDKSLKALFEDNVVYVFEKAFNHSKLSDLQKTYRVESNNAATFNKFMIEGAHVFSFGEDLGTVEYELGEYPNDYGQTTIGNFNLGLNANLSNFDCIDAPSAWDITKGSSSIKIGISDGEVLADDADFANKTLVLPNAPTTDAWHGSKQASIAAARGNNGYGLVGVCQDCEIISNDWGDYDRLLELSYAGAKVINCSWGAYRTSPVVTHQRAIDEIYDNGSVVVAISHNSNWTNNPGTFYNYPGSYEKVISVGSVAQRHETPLDSLVYMDQVSQWWSFDVKNHIGYALVWSANPQLDPNATYTIHPNGTNTLNSAVDIMAPGNRIFNYGKYLVDNEWGYNLMHTSPAAPHVTGTLGLMFSLNSCLTFEEAESILKIGSTNIDHIEAHQFAAGKYGSGSLNTYKSLKLTQALMTPSQTAYVENQSFSRWEFLLNAISENVIIRNQSFKDDAVLDLNSKNNIEIKENTLLLPNVNGHITLNIDENLTINTECLPPGAPPILGSQKSMDSKELKNEFIVYPTIFDNNVTITSNKKLAEFKKVKIYNLFGMEVYSMEGLETHELIVDLSNLSSGFYLVNIYDKGSNVVVTKKIIKK